MSATSGSTGAKKTALPSGSRLTKPAPARQVRCLEALAWDRPAASATAPWLRGSFESSSERRILRRDGSPRALNRPLTSSIMGLLSCWDMYLTPCPNDHPEILFVKILVCALRKIVIKSKVRYKVPSPANPVKAPCSFTCRTWTPSNPLHQAVSSKHDDMII